MLQLMPRHSPLAIANEFLEKNKDTSIPAQMQLQKWVYNANGWNLAVNGQPLVSEPPEAWDNGPVFRQIWDHIRDYGFSKDGLLVDKKGRPFKVHLSSEEEDVLKRAWRKYRDFSGFQMSRMSHQTGTPWHTAYFGPKGRNSYLSSSETRAYFKKLALAGRD